MPKKTPVIQPAPKPMMGAHNRNIPEPRIATTTITRTVAAAVAGAAAGEAHSGTSTNFFIISGPIMTGIRSIAVPATVGVNICRRSDNFPAMMNWKKEEMMIKLANRPGPPCSSAETQTGRKTFVLPMSRI